MKEIGNNENAPIKKDGFWEDWKISCKSVSLYELKEIYSVKDWVDSVAIGEEERKD